MVIMLKITIEMMMTMITVRVMKTMENNHIIF